MGLLNTSYESVLSSSPKRSDKVIPASPVNVRGLLDAATMLPVAGDAISGGLAVSDYLKGDYGSAAMNALGVLPFIGGAGMIKGPMGRIAETSADSNLLADMLERAGNKAGYTVIKEGSNVSPSKYVTFKKANDDIGESVRQVRISNHADKYPELANGIRTSSDPDTGVTFEQSVNWLAKQGFPTSLSTRYREIPSWQQAIENEAAKRSSLQGKLDGLIGAWRNMPKATRGNMPTIEDVESGMTALDLMRRK